jgi:MraZ protein
MSNFLGEYSCSVDDKGRVKMPVSLKVQFPAEDGGKFMIAKGLDDCLVIYPMESWKEQEKRLRKLDKFNPEHRQFINGITIGLTQMELDSNDRLLISKQLMKYIGNAREVIVKGDFDQIQIWDASKYEQYTQLNIANMPDISRTVSKYLNEQEEKTK